MKFFTALSKLQIKLILLAIGLVIAVSAILYARNIANEIIEQEEEKIALISSHYKKISDLSKLDEFQFVVRNITPTISFPVIITDENDKPLEPFDTWTLNTGIDSTMPYEEQKEIVYGEIESMKGGYEPIVVTNEEGQPLNKFYYSNSDLIDRLQIFPILAIIIIGVFVIVGYIAFSNVRSSQESKVWVGMAKEAAHQLGTPLSSMLAWIEILKYKKTDPDAVYETAMEMQNDINRLNIIATRFSKIGSQPELKKQNISENLNQICAYFEKRLPHLGKKISIIKNFESSGSVAEVNPELFAWVMENLLKNAAEAIENKDGWVEIEMLGNDGKITILVSDNGKGMTKKQRRQVFHPGYTTKKRGWGLGLSLCRRIIEQYHNGRIFVKDSAPGKGAVFAVEIPASQESSITPPPRQ